MSEEGRRNVYQSPLTERYASKEMSYIFSEERKFQTWRQLWIALAEAERQLGVKTATGEPITEEQIDEMYAHMTDVNYEVAKAREKVVRHDVMAHVYAYGQQCPTAAGIIHLGATSCYVTDNTDLKNLKDALELVEKKLLGVMKLLADFAEYYEATPILGLTHGQPAAVVTVGKRATLWLEGFEIAYNQLRSAEASIQMLGCRGATGTADTFLKLFKGDADKVDLMEGVIAEKMGFKDVGVFAVSGQTYPRILDTVIVSALALVATAAYKMANDIRFLQSRKEIEEPFEESQIGSSAMPYKRNPMRSERICSLADYVMAQPNVMMKVAATQWMERTLDDSAARRIVLPETFLATDGILRLCANVIDGLVVNEAVIDRYLQEELPFIAEETMLMKMVERGMSRQEAHERLRKYSMEAGYRVKRLGLDNGLLEKVAEDKEIPLTLTELKEMMDPRKMLGCCERQVMSYVERVRCNYLYSDFLIDKEVEV